jgi:hypothetical protein
MPVAPSDGALRYAKWAARFQRDPEGKLPQASTVLLDRMLQKPEVTARVQASFDDIYAAEGAVRQVLNSAGVSVIQYAFYLNFGREMWKLTNRISGESAAQEAAIQIGKWVARGLSLSVLETIRSDVFGVSAPAGP